jgi:hypothetical protein
MKNLLLVLLVFGMSSCQKNKLKNATIVAGDYMIVGWTGGFAGTSVHNYYLISHGEVRKDVAQWKQVPDDLSKFDFSEVIPVSKYNAVKDIPNSIPAELLNMNNQDIGVAFPDAGFTDIRTTINGVPYRWAFEADISASSPAVQQFVASAQRVF